MAQESSSPRAVTGGHQALGSHSTGVITQLAVLQLGGNLTSERLALITLMGLMCFEQKVMFRHRENTELKYFHSLRRARRFFI